jgi:hypothetical protein
MLKKDTAKLGWTTVKIFALVPVVWVSLANFALVPYWISEILGGAVPSSYLPEPLVLTSIFVFFAMIASLFFNRVFSLVFEEVGL